MKKYFLFSFVTLFVAVSCIGFTSCSDDDDDEDKKGENTESPFDSKIIGVWIGKYTDGVYKESGFTFNEDKSGSTYVVPGNYTESYDYTWRIDKDSIIYLKPTASKGETWYKMYQIDDEKIILGISGSQYRKVNFYKQK